MSCNIVLVVLRARYKHSIPCIESLRRISTSFFLLFHQQFHNQTHLYHGYDYILAESVPSLEAHNFNFYFVRKAFFNVGSCCQSSQEAEGKGHDQSAGGQVESQNTTKKTSHVQTI